MADTNQEPGLIYPIFVSLCGWRAEANALLGRFDSALASVTEALRVANEIQHPSSCSIASAFLGYIRLLQGDVEAAREVLQRGLAISEEHDLVHGICANGVYLAWASLLAGNRARRDSVARTRSVSSASSRSCCFESFPLALPGKSKVAERCPLHDGLGAAEGDALWVYVVGAPSNGKTELLRAFREPKNETTYFLSSLSPNSLVSGLKEVAYQLVAPRTEGQPFTPARVGVLAGRS